jgi:FLVCR family feline leukemia virus subgroup C receptor-related protein
MGRPFIINIQANVAQDWFSPEDKTTVMIAFSFLITCSNILGVLVPGVIFRGFMASTKNLGSID